MSALSSALIVIFVLTITSLSALYFFVTRHQRRFRRQSRLTTATPTDHESTTTTESAYYVPSKELLYFFWWNNQNRPVGHTPQTTFQEPRPDPSAPNDVEIDVLKLIAALQGHTRSPLFTIIEEQKTETTDQSHNTQHINDNRTSLSSSDEDIIGRVSLSGSLGLVGDSAAADVADSPVITSDEEVEEEEEMTTPNASPPYLTPSDSPLHDYSNIDSTFHVHNFIANSRGRRGSRRSRRPRAELQAKDDDLDKAAPPFEESEETGEKVGPRPVSETP